MILAHGDGPAATADPMALIGAGAASAVLSAYLVTALRQTRRDPRGWPGWRTGSFSIGMLLVVATLVGPLADASGFAGHMLRHLVIGMYAPLALVLGAPVTLALRALGTRAARLLVRLLRSRPARLVGHPVTALLLSAGGTVLLYLTPLYQLTERQPLAHHAVHAHFLAAGYLFCWVIAGPDPSPHRPSVPARLVVLGVAVAAHATLSQLLYAGLPGALPVPGDELRVGATLMYYGGDLGEILLALALLATWRPGHRRSPAPRASVVDSAQGRTAVGATADGPLRTITPTGPLAPASPSRDAVRSNY